MIKISRGEGGYKRGGGGEVEAFGKMVGGGGMGLLHKKGIGAHAAAAAIPSRFVREADFEVMNKILRLVAGKRRGGWGKGEGLETGLERGRRGRKERG